LIISIGKRIFPFVAGFPITIELSGRACVVVGGGEVAERKVEALVAAGAAVTVVSPELSPGLERLAEAGRIGHVRRPYRQGDVAGAALAFVAAGDPTVTAEVAEEGRRVGVWVNAADDPEHCDFFLPAVVRRGPLVVAVGTGGTSPALARAVREHLERLLPGECAELAEAVADVRRELRALTPRPHPSAWHAALADEVGRVAAGAGCDGARARLRGRLGAR
jgi:siroheme synthase-like protein